MPRILGPVGLGRTWRNIHRIENEKFLYFYTKKEPMPLGGSGSNMMAAYKANRKLLSKKKSLKDVYDKHPSTLNKDRDHLKAKSIHSKEYQELKEKHEIEQRRDNMKRVMLILFLAFLGILTLVLIL